MHQHLWYRGGDIAHIQHGEDTEEEIHGCVQTGVHEDQGNNEPVACKCREVDQQEDTEEDDMNLGISGETQKDEFIYGAVVLPGEVLHSPSAAEKNSSKCG